jgi:hypothetical protein
LSERCSICQHQHHPAVMPLRRSSGSLSPTSLDLIFLTLVRAGLPVRTVSYFFSDRSPGLDSPGPVAGPVAARPSCSFVARPTKSYFAKTFPPPRLMCLTSTKPVSEHLLPNTAEPLNMYQDMRVNIFARRVRVHVSAAQIETRMLRLCSYLADIFERRV